MPKNEEEHAATKKHPWYKQVVWRWGLVAGVMIAVVSVLASGFMVEVTNTDTFCVSCHLMTPFRTSWQDSVHGGRNPQGFTAQCVDCHLPHGSFGEYLVAKAITGTNDVIHNIYINEYEFDWAANTEENRLKFTYDNACMKCHADLTPRGMQFGALIAHRSYLRGETNKKCASCHPRVGHKDMIEEANRYFKETRR